jgi:hypothetical protein
MKAKQSSEGWISLEQVSQALGVPWFIVWRWARDGDPRLPAYRFWTDRYPQQGGYRFREQDVAILQQGAPIPSPI